MKETDREKLASSGLSYVRYRLSPHGRFLTRAGSQPYHAFPEPDGSSGTRQDIGRGQLEFRRAPIGLGGTPEGTPPTRFGTVRPRVQIPGPRPISEFKIADFRRRRKTVGRREVTAVSQIFLELGRGMDCGPSIELAQAIAQPIYQRAHGPGTVRHLGSKIKGAVDASVQPTHKSRP